jgi:hypothetical protein
VSRISISIRKENIHKLDEIDEKTLLLKGKKKKPWKEIS